MKKLNLLKKITFGLSISMLLLSHGCTDVECFNVTGLVVDRPYSIAAINGIELYNDAEIFLAQGDSQSVVLHSDEELFKILQFHYVNGVLLVEYSEDCVEDLGTFELYITTTQEIESIEIIGSGSVTAIDSIRSTDLSIDISGSGSVSFNELYVQNLNLNVSGSGNVMISGPDTCISQINSTSGSGGIFTFGIASDSVSVESTGAGEMELTAIDTLYGSITGSGNVRYKGQPGIDVSVTGTGELINAN